MLNAKRQYRISVFGVYQFTVSAFQGETVDDVADRAATTMKLQHLRFHSGPGLIDFRP